MVIRVALTACSLSVVRADYWLQRSWPSSSTCDPSTPSFTYVDTGANFNIQNYNNQNNGKGVLLGMCNPTGDGGSTLTSCNSPTSVTLNSWLSPIANCNMSQAQQSGYPQNASIANAGTGQCTQSPYGTSTLGMCVRSTPPYVPYASEPVVTNIFSSNYVTDTNCSADYPTDISSASLALPPCATIAAFPTLSIDGSNGNAPTISALAWGSISFTASCMSGNVTSLYYSNFPLCVGTPTSYNFTAGICTATAPGVSVVMPFTSACGGGAAFASTALSAGAIVGIVIGVIFLAGLAAAAFMFCGGGLKRKALFFSSDDVTVMKP